MNNRTPQRSIRMCGIRCGDIEEWTEALPFPKEVRFHVIPAPAGVDLLLTGEEAAGLDEATATVKRRWGAFCYSFLGETLEEVVGGLLLKEKKRIAIAESCTGGRISARMTRVPGSSRYFESACVTYSNRSKERLLSVPASLLREKGAV
ncbi:MAG: CinA family protein, partial [Nitrospiria bacterium]